MTIPGEIDPSQAPNTLDPSYHTAIVDAMTISLEEENEPLYSIEERDEPTGIERNIDVIVGGTTVGDVSLAFYEADDRGYFASMEGDVIGDSLPIGHIDIKSELDPTESDANLSGRLYILENGRVIVSLDCAKKTDEEFSDDSTLCFKLADSMGLGEAWFQFLGSGLRNDNPKFDLDNQMAERLLYFLRTQRGQPPSQ